MATDPPSRIADWLRAARAGDAAARNELLGACRGFLAVVARAQLDRRLQARVDASDVVQQSLLDAHNGLDDFRGETPAEWMAWLGRIASRNAVDAARQYRDAAKRDPARERALAVGSGEDALAPAARDPSPSQAVAGLERELRVAAALEQRPEDYREVVLLRNIERLPFDEVAVRMSRSRGACQMLWLRAMERLRALLLESM
jgi:RNA polymerase sigma-70 factor (ECF subfamily)